MPVASKWKPVLFSVGVLIAIVTLSNSFDLRNNAGVSTHKQQTPKVTEVTCMQDPVACQGDNPMSLAYAAAAQHVEEVNAYLAAAEEARLQELARQRTATTPTGSSYNLPAECSGKVIPEYIIMRESHCNYGSVNWGGCGGSNCYGMYQIAGSHWNGGACSDLNWEIPADQDECARRLSSDGTNLRPWGA